MTNKENEFISENDIHEEFKSEYEKIISDEANVYIVFPTRGKKI